MTVVPAGPRPGDSAYVVPTPHPAAAPPPAPGPAPGPNYTSALQSDPNYLAWQTDSIRNLSDAASTRQAAIRALVEQFGGMPAGFHDQYGDLTSADLALAAQNPYSTEADLKRAYQQNVVNMQKALAARGALHSGDLGYNQNQLDTQYGQDQYDAGQQFAQDLQQAIGAYTSAQDQGRQAQEAAIAAAYADIIGNPAYVPQ